MSAGERPTDVVIVDRATGAETPCELVYEGIDENGIGVWGVSEHNVFDPNRHFIKVGRMPGRTGIAFATVPPGGAR